MRDGVSATSGLIAFGQLDAAGAAQCLRRAAAIGCTVALRTSRNVAHIFCRSSRDCYCGRTDLVYPTPSHVSARQLCTEMSEINI